MPVDVTEVAGFPLKLDLNELMIETGEEYLFDLKERRASDLEEVLRSPNAVDPAVVMYRIFYLQRAPRGVEEEFKRLHLTYGLVLVPPGQVAGEYVKTTGHYHPTIPGSSIAYPEIYQQVYGRLLLLMQKEQTAASGELGHCLLVDMKPGSAITLPPGYGHSIINPTNRPGLIAGLYCSDFAPEYGPIRARRGMGYYIMAEANGYYAAPNPNYTDLPPLEISEIISTVRNPSFVVPDPKVGIWRAFAQAPDRYAFLSKAERAEARFCASNS